MTPLPHPPPLPSPWWGLSWRKSLILITLDRWKRHFREENYIENYFYLLKVLKVLLKNVEEILFGRIFLHTAQTVSKHVRVRRWKAIFKCLVNNIDLRYIISKLNVLPGNLSQMFVECLWKTSSMFTFCKTMLKVTFSTISKANKKCYIF